VDRATGRFAAVGHIEWVEFGRVEHVPRAGEVVHARDPFHEPAGGGAVAAVQLARLAGGAQLYTALGRDEHAERALARLRELGVVVHAQRLADPTRWAVTLVDDRRERTIMTFGKRLEPIADGHPAPVLGRLDGVYFTAGDAALLKAAREAARVLVASPRARHALAHGVRLDALVLSADDPIEREAAEPALADADVVVLTEGERGGRFRMRSGEEGRWAATPPPGPVLDSYGCGDSFAAALTYGLGRGLPLPGALRLAALCGAACLTAHGPYGGQLGVADVGEAGAWQDAPVSAGDGDGPRRGGS
jgi:ribokinase